MERRRKDNKTDYRARLAMLKSGKPRLVVRKTGRYINANIVTFEGNGDKVLKSCSSRELEGYGWKASKKNTSAAYLTGLLLAKKSGKQDVIVDIGLHNSTKGNRIYALVKGASDGGISVSVGDLVPTEDRIKGSHVSSFANSLDEDSRAKTFSAYLKSGVDPKGIEGLFEIVKSKISGVSKPAKIKKTQEVKKKDTEVKEEIKKPKEEKKENVEDNK